MSSCRNSGNPSVESINIPFQSFNFYKDFSALDTNHLQSGIVALKAQYPDFLDIYLDQLSGINTRGNYVDTTALLGFLTHPDFKALFQTVQQKFPDTKAQDAALKKMLQHIRYFDSSIVLPEKVYYYAAGLNYAATLLPENCLGIGLDMFLGRDFPPYEQVNIPYYLTIRNTPENIPIAAAQVIYDNQYPFSFEDKNLLQLMIAKGKQAFFLKNILPDAPESLFFLFSKEQMQWCEKNEALIYNYFLQNNLLYETNGQKIYRYLNDAPTSTGMPPESPGNTASFIGYKIVESYARKSGKTLKEIMEENDARKILDGAGYKPR
jgi:hypothetical protein